VHIVAAESAEAKALYRFRDVLRIDAKLRDAYQARKRAILESGTSDPAGYTHAKGEFINAVVGSNAPPSDTAAGTKTPVHDTTLRRKRWV
jgi:GrpB-like predicted nucleotidyltransferase (UPF0157 family)